ncbi:MAG: HEPN domain-containing protein [Thermoproteales archaeon]|nr:HEPN domain-containing protein [Thermoproteales archaeon]
MIREEALDWFEEAKIDLERAERAEKDKDYSLACYMSQQAIEKAFKACFIGLLRKRPPHVHDLTMLYEELKSIISLPDEIKEALSEISQYYVTARYPNAGIRRPSRSFSKTQSTRAIEVAKNVIEKIEKTFFTS